MRENCENVQPPMAEWLKRRVASETKMKLCNPWSVEEWLIVDPEISANVFAEVGLQQPGVGERLNFKIDADPAHYISLAKGPYPTSSTWFVSEDLALAVVGGTPYTVARTGTAEQVSLLPVIGVLELPGPRLLLLWSFTDIAAVGVGGTLWILRGIMDDDLVVELEAGNRFVVRGTRSGGIPHELRLELGIP